MGLARGSIAPSRQEVLRCIRCGVVVLCLTVVLASVLKQYASVWRSLWWFRLPDVEMACWVFLWGSLACSPSHDHGLRSTGQGPVYLS